MPKIDFESHLRDQLLEDLIFLATPPSRCTLEEALVRLDVTGTTAEKHLRAAGRLDIHDALIANGGLTGNGIRIEKAKKKGAKE
jgi:hypothetical protein